MPKHHNPGAVSTASPGLQFPLVVAEWDRNAREVIRVALDQYNGHHTVNVRVWYRAGDVLKPGKTGITVGVKHLAALAQASGKALERAIELGLVEDTGGGE
ncbi:MAG: transcriptional coactivator p15/PC4 family protein [Hyphomicrobiaceae bacterium]